VKALVWYVLECEVIFKEHRHLNLIISLFHRKPPILLEYTGYSRYDIIDCATHIAKKVSEEPVTASNRELIAVKRKYDSKKYLNVSTSVDLPSVHQIQIDM
jgi:hypothetical protein